MAIIGRITLFEERPHGAAQPSAQPSVASPGNASFVLPDAGESAHAKGLARMFRSHRSTFEACGGGAARAINVRFDINERGYVTALTFQEPAPAVEACLERLLGDLRVIPASAEPVEVDVVLEWRVRQ